MPRHIFCAYFPPKKPGEGQENAAKTQGVQTDRYRDARQTLLCPYVMELVRRLSNKQVSISIPCLLWHHLSASTWGWYISACISMGIISLVDCSLPAILPHLCLDSFNSPHVGDISWEINDKPRVIGRNSMGKRLALISRNFQGWNDNGEVYDLQSPTARSFF